MSLSKADNSKEIKERKRYKGIMGFYLEVAGEPTKYGVTCRHVTDIADCILYIENKSKQLIKFGQTLDRRSSLTSDCNRVQTLNNSTLKPPDINVFEIDANFATICSPSYRNRNGQVVNCRLYTGNIESLYGCTVFQCSVEDNKILKKKCFNAKIGRVLSDEEHQAYKDIVNLKADFLIRGTEDENFAKKGDSGRIVAIEKDDNTIEIVGIIKSGEFTSPDGKTDSSLCICILLSKGIEFLNKEYCKEFTLSVTSNHGLEIGRHIEPGQMILFHTPEQTKPTDFVLADRLLMLIDVLNLECKDEPSLDIIILFETDLNEQVYQRIDLEELEYLASDQACIQQGLIACSKVYSGELGKAEKHLKKACRMISSKSSFPLRLLCRIICYTTWLMIEKEQIKEVGPLLEKGIIFMEKHRDNLVCPKDCLGYQYYDQSRYLQTNPKPECQRVAKTRALQAIDIIEEDKRNNGGHAEILALAYANFAHLQLECGEHFEGENRIIADTDMMKAEQYLNNAEATKSSDNSVEYIYIQKAWGDLYFRKGDYKISEKYFKSGVRKAEQLHLTKESLLCKERLDIVHVYCKRTTRRMYIVALLTIAITILLGYLFS